MAMVWGCPKCGRCYAPFVSECPYEKLDKQRIQNTGNVYKNEKCLACGDYHGIGIACPGWEVTS